MATPAERVTETRTNQGAQVALIVGILLVVVLGLWFFLLRGGDEEPTALAPTTTPTTEPLPEETEEPDGPRRGRGPVETFELFAARDPFDPLVAAEATGGAGPAGNPPTTGTNGTDTGTGTATGGTGTGGSGGISGGGGENVGGHRVRLVDVFVQGGRNRAQVQVDGTVYTVDEGETFADNFQLLSVEGQCATMLFGDDQFTICEGEEILK